MGDSNDTEEVSNNSGQKRVRDVAQWKSACLAWGKPPSITHKEKGEEGVNQKKWNADLEILPLHC
jgi:hypothetical protein